MAQALADCPNAEADAVDGAIDDAGVNYAPERVGEITQRPHDRSVVQLIPPPFIAQEQIDGRRALFWSRHGAAGVDQEGKPNAGNRRDRRGYREGDGRLLRDVMLFCRRTSALPLFSLSFGGWSARFLHHVKRGDLVPLGTVFRIVEHGLQEGVNGSRFRRPADQPAKDHRRDRQQHQWYRHRWRRLVWMDVVGVESWLPSKDEEDEPEHVERGEEGRYQSDDSQDLPDRNRDLVRDPRAEDDLVFRPEPGERDHSGVGKRGGEEGPERHRHPAPEPAHTLDVLFFVHAVDDAAGAEEETSLEEGMGDEVEDGRDEGAHTRTHRHVAELRQRRVRDDALNVVLGYGDSRRHERGKGADQGNDQHGGRRGFIERVRTHDQVDAGGDHRRGMDQRRDRGRPLHGVRQPDMQRELRALASRTAEEQEGDGGDHRHRGSGHLSEDLAEFERAELIEDPDQPQPKCQVADAVDDERLLRGAGGGAASEPEPDQQVRRQTNPLPEEEEEKEVIGQDQHQHREDEEGKVGEEAGKTGVALHIPLGIDVDQKSDAGNHDQHHRRQLVDEEVDADVERAGLDPGVELLPQRLTRGADLAEYQQRKEEGGEDRRR